MLSIVVSERSLINNYFFSFCQFANKNFLRDDVSMACLSDDLFL